MAERVPIWYEAHAGHGSAVEPYANVQNTAVRLHRELNLSVAVACERAQGEITCIASSGPAAPAVGTVVDREHGICAACVRGNRVQLANEAASDSMVLRSVCERLGIGSVCAIPLRHDSRCIGFLAAFSDAANRFDLSLIQRMRGEARSIERSLLGTTSPGIRLISAPEVPRTAELTETRVPTFGRYTNAGSSSQNCHRRVLLGTRVWALSIPAAASCVLLVALVLPRALRSKDSHALPQPATNSRAIPAEAPEAAIPQFRGGAADATVQPLRERAEAGEVRAQRALALRYERGDGLARDQIKACVWYIIAGASGDLAAKQRAVQLSHRLSQYQIAEIRFNVGKMYMEGLAGQRDLVSAYSWFALAQAAGDIRAPVEQEKLESVMTHEQVLEGWRRASAWLLAHHVRGNHERTVLASISPHTRPGSKSIR